MLQLSRYTHMDNKEIKVLDFGYVKLIETWGSDERIIEAARQSTSAGFKGWGPPKCNCCNGEGIHRFDDGDIVCTACKGEPHKPGDEKLLRYLYEHKHMTPFEMAGMIIEVQAPIFVFREWHRHRTQCVSGDTVLVFNRPNDGKAYRKRLEDVVSMWKNPAQRDKIASMQLRGDSGSVSITDAWLSGEKKVYTVKTKYGTVKVSADHAFKTPDGKSNITNGLDYILGVIQVGMKEVCQAPQINETTEEWRPINEWYDVSNQGRVRSWTYQGARGPHRKRTTEPTIKSITINGAGRAITNLGGQGAFQISHLVAKAFLDWDGSDCILHVNDNPMDNRIDNLRVGTNAENVKDQYLNGRRKFLREAPVKVLAIEEAGTEQTFDISVTGNHWFVADNLLIHNSYNELSARYTPIPDVNYVPTLERLMLNAEGTNKQAGRIADAAELTEQSATDFLEEVNQIYGILEASYQAALKRGIPKEVARIILPVGRYSRMRASANLRNWLAFLTLRQDESAQWEIRQYANALATFLEEKFPRTMALFRENQD